MSGTASTGRTPMAQPPTPMTRSVRMTTRNRFAIAKLTTECMARFPGSMLVADLFAQKDRLQIEATLGYDGLAPVEPFEDLGPILAPLADLDGALFKALLAGPHADDCFSPPRPRGPRGGGGRPP